MTEAPPANSSPWRGFWFWTLVLLLVKTLFIVTLSDIFFYGEELEKGSVSKAMLDRIPVDFHRLTYHYYEGGGFFVSGLKAFVFMLVGENILAHRIVGLLTCWLVFLGLWRLTRAHLGPTAAHFAAALFVFAPAGLQRYSLLTLGIHFEALALGLPLLDEGLRLIRRRDWIPSPRRAIGVGLLAGFAVFFSYQNLLILGWVGLWVIALRWRWLMSKGGLYLALGALIGLSPMLYMAWHVGGALFDVHGTDLAKLESNSVRLQSWLRSLYVDVPTFTLVLRIFYPCALLVSIGMALAFARSQQLLLGFLLGFLGLWMCAWYFGPFLADNHVHWFAWLRWAPMSMVCIILAALGLAQAWHRGGAAHRTAQGLLGITLVLGLVQTVQILAASQWRTPAANWTSLTKWKGYNYRGHFRTLLPHLEGQEPEDVRALLAFDEPHPALLYADIATVVTQQSKIARSPEEWMAWFTEVDAENLDLFVRGMGPAMVAPFGGSLTKALHAIESAPEAQRLSLAWAIGYFGTGWSLFPELIAKDIEAIGGEPDLNPTLRDACLQGIGARVFRVCVVYPYGRHLVMNPNASLSFLAKQGKALEGPLKSGFEAEKKLWVLP